MAETGQMIPSDGYGELRPLDGGYSGETYLGGIGADQAVVRIYARNPARAAVDASLLRLVRGLVPVPEVLELRHPTRDTPATLVTEYVPGTRLDVALAERPDWLDEATLGRSVGRILNTLSGIPFLRFALFAELFDVSRGPQVLVVTFIAMLELARERLLEVTQAEAFAPIYVRLAYAPV